MSSYSSCSTSSSLVTAKAKVFYHPWIILEFMTVVQVLLSQTVIVWGFFLHGCYEFCSSLRQLLLCKVSAFYCSYSCVERKKNLFWKYFFSGWRYRICGTGVFKWWKRYIGSDLAASESWQEICFNYVSAWLGSRNQIFLNFFFSLNLPKSFINLSILRMFHTHWQVWSPHKLCAGCCVLLQNIQRSHHPFHCR